MILNPTTPIGPGDAKPTPTGRIIVDFLNKRFPAYVDTGLNLVDVSEVARMHVVALDRGTPGERYILGGENLTLKQILDRMSAITGLPSPTMKVPHAVAMAFAFFDEIFTGKIRGKEPRATVEAVRMGKKMMFASSAKAERDLGFKVFPSTTLCEPQSTGSSRMDMRLNHENRDHRSAAGRTETSGSQLAENPHRFSRNGKVGRHAKRRYLDCSLRRHGG